MRKHLAQHLDVWGLAPDGEPFETHSSWLAFVRRGDARAMLKVFKPESDEAPSARYLMLHRGHGTVRVLENDNRAVLLERIDPGTRLTSYPPDDRDDEATHIICDTIEKLQGATVDPAGWPGHDLHYDEFEKSSALAPLTPQIAARAAAMMCELTTSEPQRVLLHGDLHLENILFDAARGWLAIDPKGEVGEIAYELAAPLRNPLERSELFMSEAQMDRRVRIYCERLGVDRQRVLGWCFARNCSAALWYAGRTPEPLRDKAWPAATLTALKLLQG
ncbi:MAG TPA: aminoglycoside phosphotransferase family protein [Rhizomicrobium sp.]|nr:aminoglycoside phosphotransferase family protein [Rhizomicrobium sp.]